MNRWDANAFGVPAEPVLCLNCQVEIDPGQDKDLCEKCHEYFYCECGQKLEESWGSPGDGFCIRCR